MTLKFNNQFYKFALWPHQLEAITSVENYLDAFSRKETNKSMLIQMSTGSGKSGVIAIAARFIHCEGAVLVLTPRISLKNQLYRDIDHRFFEHIKYNTNDLPKAIRRIDKCKAPPLDGDYSDIVFVTTIQKLVSLRNRHATVFKNFIKKIAIVIVDEGHYEPSKEWSKAIREICVPKIVFTATPYRNDLKIFDIDLKYTYAMSYLEAVSKSYLRSVQIVEREPFHNPRDFVVDVLEFYKLQFKNLGNDPPRVIIRCDDRVEIRQIARELINHGQSVVAIHERFSDKNGEVWESRAVPDPESESAVFWIHQFKLLEGIDDHRFQVLALYKKIENGRAFIQQVGRIIRNPSLKKDAHGYMLDHWNGHHANLWKGFLRYDGAILSHGPKAVRLPTSKDLIKDFIKCQAPTGYMQGRFRAPFKFDDINPHHDLQLPLRTNLLVKMENFRMERFVKDLIDIYDEKDRMAKVYKLKPNTCVVLSVNCSNSSYLLNHVFIEADLHVAVIHEFDDYVGFYETSGLSINWNDIGLHIPAHPDSESGGIRTLNRDIRTPCEWI